MPDPQQRQYASTDPNFGQAERTYASTDPNFTPAPDRSVAPSPPAEKTTGGRLINLFKLFAPAVIDPAGLAGDKLKSTAADVAAGGAKSVARTAEDWVNSYGAGLPQIEDLQSSNTAERLGGIAADVATSVVPAAAGARATASAVRGAAVPMWQNAARRPMLESPKMAEDILGQGFGRLTRANAQRYLASPNSIAAKAPTMKSRAEAFKSIEDSYKRGIEMPQTRSVIGAATSPHVRSAVAQGLYSSAPATGGGTGIALLLARLLGGGQ